jgi:para-aminobenzoate synthetase/4-amino-4-deoxychorismate lyase
MPSLAVLYDPRADRWLRFSDPVAEIECHRLKDVIPALNRIEQHVEQEGLYAAGLVSYEAARAFDEALQTHDSVDFPLLRFGLFAKAEQIELPRIPETMTRPEWQPQDDLDSFSFKVKEIRDAIARGETYQVNLTFPLRSSFTQSPWEFFLQLVHGQQASGAGFLQSERWAICSVSPELFFSRDGNQLTMRPMKGTAPRGRTLEEDQRLAKALLESAKNRAENIMILDMVRNDLGRLAPPGEVTTEQVCSLEKYPTVWQLTSTVTARSKASLAETFQALFPCASITGAPKAKTMQIIKANEEQPRSIYTGTFGWLEPGQKAHFNVAIRTLLVDRKHNMATYGVGAGVTWDSDSTEEYQECLAKAEVLKQPLSDFALIETLRWTPGKGYFILPEHLARLERSAKYFNFSFSIKDVTAYLHELAENFPATPQRVRLLMHKDGLLESSRETLPANTTSTPLKICLAAEPVHTGDIRLYHKTTRRQLYEHYLAEAKNVDEVVLWNERGEITECCTANLVVEHAGEFLTPPICSGLLPGTYREYLLSRGILKEQALTVNDLQNSTRIYLINAVRKWRKALLIHQ